MHEYVRFRLVAGILGATLALAVTGCVVVPAHERYDSGGAVVEVSDYYYYPDIQVYYSISTGYYFYRSGGIWVRARMLPRRYILNPRSRVRIRAPRHRPYEHFPDHQRMYREQPRYRPQPEHDRRLNRESRPGGYDRIQRERGQMDRNEPTNRRPETRILIPGPRRDNGRYRPSPQHPERSQPRATPRSQPRATPQKKGGKQGKSKEQTKSRDRGKSGDRTDDQDNGNSSRFRLNN